MASPALNIKPNCLLCTRFQDVEPTRIKWVVSTREPVSPGGIVFLFGVADRFPFFEKGAQEHRQYKWCICTLFQNIIVQAEL